MGLKVITVQLRESERERAKLERENWKMELNLSPVFYTQVIKNRELVLLVCIN